MNKDNPDDRPDYNPGYGYKPVTKKLPFNVNLTMTLGTQTSKKNAATTADVTKWVRSMLLVAESLGLGAVSIEFTMKDKK